ncbi:MAG TPA: helix-turn-helix domain-containing protein [Nocardioides sp.]|nr:helix-turn-helix domain-containing protein [Nocardioides sp.]
MEAEHGAGAFAAVLRRLRESRSLTQEELAERSGVTAKAISALERGERRRPYPHTVRSLADGLALDDAERAGLLAAVPRRAPVAAAPPAPTVPSLGPDSSTPSAAGRTFGRDDELDRLLDLVTTASARLVTLTGAGGVGKTRLATELLARAGGSFPDGTAFVDLAAVRDPALVLPRVAAALGVVEGVRAAGLVDRLAAHLAGRRVLVVLDNLEQVLSAAPVVADLVSRVPGLTVVSTSRAPLRVRAERELPVGPLALPEDDEPASVSGSAAVALFVDRASATGAVLSVTPDNAAVLAAIARRLDGLPLALELAAAGARVLPPEALLTRLESHGPDAGLRAGPRDLPDRQRTMTAVLDWSADLLEPEESDLLLRLSVFSGGFSLDSVEAVVAASGGVGRADDVLPALTSLVEQSLVVPVPTPDGVPRFRLLEPVRQYAAVRAHGAGLGLAAAEAHAEHFRDLAVATHPRLLSAAIAPVLDRLEADHANLRSAHLRLLELGQDAEAARLVFSLWLHLGLRGYAREGLGWLDAVTGAGTDAAVARAAVARMGLLLVVGDVPGIRREAAVAVPLARRLGDATLEGEATVLAGLAAVFAGDLDTGDRLLRPEAEVPDAIAERWISLHCVIGLGQAALMGGDVPTARSLLEDALASARVLGNEFTLATTLNTLATVHEVLGDDVAAAGLLGESLRISAPLRLSWTIGYAVPALAGVASRCGHHGAAATLFGAAATLGATTAVDPHFPPSRETADAGLVTAREALGESAFLTAWEEGRSMKATSVVELAERVVGEITDRGRG